MAELPKVEVNLDTTLLVIMQMIKESRPAVKHFVDKLEKLQGMIF